MYNGDHMMAYVVTCSETDDGINWSYRVDSVFHNKTEAEDYAAKIWGDVHICQIKGKNNEVQSSEH
jgi:hypothetical protein